MKRKLLFLSVLFCTVMMQVCISLPDAHAATTGALETDVLVSLGVLDKQDAEAIDRPLNRITLAKIGSRIMNIMPVLDEETVAIADAAEEDYGYAAFVTAKGLMELDQNGRFLPNAPAEYLSLLKIILGATGHSVLAEQRGGSAADYIAVAAANKLTLSNKAPGDTVSLQEAARVVLRALETDVLQCVSVGNDINYKAYRDQNILDIYLNCRLVKGLVTDNSISALYGKSGIKEGYVKIGSEVFAVGSTDAARFLGYQVVCYVRDDGTQFPELLMVYARPQDNVRTDFYAEEVTAFSWERGRVEITYDSKTADRQEKISAAECAVILNGKSVSPNAQLFDMIQKGQGSIGYLEAAGGRQSCLFIDLYDIICVDSISAANRKIMDRYTDAVIDLAEQEKKVRCEIYKDHEKVSLTKLKQWDIIEVYRSEDDKEITYQLIVSNETVRGTVTQVSENEIVIGENTLATSYAFEQAKLNEKLRARPGDKLTVYLDAHGKAAAAQQMGSGEMYGYLRELKLQSGLGGGAMCRMLLSDGTWATLDFAPNVSVNGVRTKAEKITENPLLYSGSVQRQLVRYNLNDNGQINVLNTAVNRLSDTEFSLAYEGTTNYRIGSIINGLYQVDAAAPLFVVPKKGMGEDVFTNEENYSIQRPLNYLSSADGQCEYYFLCYDISEKYIPKALVVETDNFGATTNIDGTTAKTLLVKNITQAYEDDDIVYKISGFSGGGPVNYSLYDEKLTSAWNYTLYPVSDANNPGKITKVTDLRPGDVIVYTLNEKEKINGFYVLFARGENQVNFEMSNTDSPDMYANVFIAYGEVVNKADDRIFFEAEDGKTRMFMMNNTSIYRFQEKRNTASAVDLGSISRGDKIFVRSYYGSWMTTDIIIYE